MLQPGRQTLSQLRDHIDRRVPERLVDSVRELGPLGEDRGRRNKRDGQEIRHHTLWRSSLCCSQTGTKEKDQERPWRQKS